MELLNDKYIANQSLDTKCPHLFFYDIDTPEIMLQEDRNVSY